MTGHTEAVQVRYDAKQIAFRELVGVFFEIHDPTTYHRQGNDVGSQYRSGIYFHTDEQQAAAVEVMAEAQERFRQPIVTEIQRASEFWPAEDYHQDYYKKAATKYKYYRFRSGRDQFIKAYWKDDKTVYQLATR